MRIVLMINDNPYNNNFIKQLCLTYPSYIKGVVMSGRLLPGKPRPYFSSVLYVLKSSGLQLFLLRGIELVVYKAKHYLKYIGLYPDYFDIKLFCKKNKIPMLKSADINAREFIEIFRELRPDIVFSRINQIIKKDLLAIPDMGMINSHMSLLPKYQGVDSIFWGMVNKDEEFGVTFHFINEYLDSGDIIKQIRCSGFGESSLFSRESTLNEISSFYLAELVKTFENEKINSSPMPMKDKSYYSLAARSGYRVFRENGCRLITDLELGRLVFGNIFKIKKRTANRKTKILLEKEFNKFVLRHEPDYFKPLVEFFKRLVDIKGKRILEFGCGTGDLGLLLLEQGAQSVLGIDIAANAIQEAQEKVRRENIKNAAFICGDIMEIKLPDQAVNLIISHSVLHYIVDAWQPILAKLYGALSLKGILIASMEKEENALSIIQTLNLHFMPEVIKSRLYMLIKMMDPDQTRINSEIIKAKSRYLSIPPLSIKSRGEMMIEFAKAGFSEIQIIDIPKLHKLSRPHYAVIARKSG